MGALNGIMRRKNGDYRDPFTGKVWPQYEPWTFEKKSILEGPMDSLTKLIENHSLSLNSWMDILGTYDRDGIVEIALAAPGAKNSDLNVSIKGSRVIVKYSTMILGSQIERKFETSIERGVDPDSATAELKDGVLYIRMLKPAEGKEITVEVK